MGYEITVPLTIGLAVFFAIIGVVFCVPWLRRTCVDYENLPWYTMFFTPCVGVGQYGYYTPHWETGKADAEKAMGMQQPMPMQQQMPMQQMPMQQMPMQQQPMQQMPMQQMPMQQMPGAMPVMGSAFGGADQLGQKLAPEFFSDDIGARRPEDAEMHAVAFVVSDQLEEIYKFLQFTSCCFFSISHGANDVANALAPFATVWAVYSNGKLTKKNDVPIWLTLFGGIALDIGLLTMGHIIMKALGNRITLQSPSRGFCIELGAMFVVMIASRIGIPVSTTHCISGATIAVGLCNGTVSAINVPLICIIFFGWVITCPAAAFVTGLVFWGICSAPRPMPGNGIFSGQLPEM